MPNDHAHQVIQLAVRPIPELVDEATVLLGTDSLVMKIDIEGMEKRVLLSLPEEKLAQFRTIFVEGIGVGEALGAGWDTRVLAGYVEMIERAEAAGSERLTG